MPRVGRMTAEQKERAARTRGFERRERIVKMACIARGYNSLKDYCEAQGISYESLRRGLKGTSVLSLELMSTVCRDLHMDTVTMAALLGGKEKSRFE